jgi:hypothetical protein
MTVTYDRNEITYCIDGEEEYIQINHYLVVPIPGRSVITLFTKHQQMETRSSISSIGWDDPHFLNLIIQLII